MRSRATRSGYIRAVAAPGFAAIIPAFNAEATVEAAIESVLVQTRSDWEAVVIDDGSSDATLALCRRYEGDTRLRVITQANRGLPGARNVGIRATTAPYVAFLDSDDRWMPRYLERMGRALDEVPGAGLAYTDAWALNEGTGRIKRASAMSRSSPPDHISRDPQQACAELMRRNFMFVATTVRRAALERVGLFNETLRSAEDYELWLRLLAHGFQAVTVPGRLGIKMERTDAMSRNEMQMFAALKEVCRLVVEEHPAPEPAKAIARERHASAQRHIEFLERARGPRWTLRRARLLVGRVVRRVGERRLWHPTAPPEVARVFPDLERGGSTPP